jgi:hypothetical protein
MLKNLVYVLAALGLIFALIIGGITWKVMKGNVTSAPEPKLAQQTAAAHMICKAIQNTPDGIACTVDGINHNIHATLLHYPVGGHRWCDMYSKAILSGGLEMDGWLIHTYVDTTEKPVVSCMLG